MRDSRTISLRERVGPLELLNADSVIYVAATAQIVVNICSANRLFVRAVRHSEADSLLAALPLETINFRLD